MLLFSSSCFAHNDIKYYGPDFEKLTGTVKYLTFPGRPNYTSIKEGDEAERHPYLILDKEINIKTRLLSHIKKNQEYDFDDEINISLVQMIIHDFSDFKKIKDGQRFSVRGEISGAISGHHHAKILIVVRELNPEAKQNFMSERDLRKRINQNIKDHYIESYPFVYKLTEVMQDDFSE
jgi:hypothetical protein